MVDFSFVAPILNTNSKKAIAAAIERLRDDATLRAELGAAARDRVATRYGWDHQLDRLEAMYDRVINAG